MYRETPKDEDQHETPPKRFKVDPEEQLNTNDDNNDAHAQGVSSLTHFHLRPFRGLDRSVEPILAPDEYRAESRNIVGFSESLATLRTELDGTFAADVAARDAAYPKIVFLGTGSCIPNKTRNVSAILVHTSPDSCLLLDCGEGTAAQMRRFYGAERYATVLRQLRAIYVSHLHADHHIGLIGVLQERRRALDDVAVVGEANGTTALDNCGPVMLLAPQQIASWLHFYDAQIESLRHEYELVPNGDLVSIVVGCFTRFFGLI